MNKCKHDIPTFQSCDKCGRDMVPADKEWGAFTGEAVKWPEDTRSNSDKLDEIIKLLKKIDKKLK